MIDRYAETFENINLYALSIFEWCRAHPWATEDDFKAFLDRIADRVKTKLNEDENHDHS